MFQSRKFLRPPHPNDEFLHHLCAATLTIGSVSVIVLSDKSKLPYVIGKLQ